MVPMKVRTRTIAEAISDLICGTHNEINEAILDRAVEAFVDTVGVALAGASEPAVEIAAKFASAQFAAGGAAATAVVETTQRLSTCGAAFVNAIASHALDYDDVSSTMEGHPSALLVPVLLAAAEGSSATGRDVLEAYLIGLQVSSSIGAGFDMRAAYAHGWHTTSVLGAPGAAAAVARLRGLAPPQVRMAIGIAGSVAAGSRASFGTMVKPLHVGVAAVQAIMAVQLAQSGYSANPDIIGAPLGFLALHVGDVIDQSAIEHALARPVGAVVAEVDVKRYPCCYHSHRMIDAALTLRSGLLTSGSHVDVSDVVEQVRITTAPGGTAALLFHRPVSATEAKFSAEYTVSAALLDGAISGATFKESAIAREAVRTLMSRTEVGEQDVPPIGPRAWEDSYAVVQVVMRDGRRVAERVDVPKGGHLNPLSASQLEEKFLLCSEQHPSRMVDGVRGFGLLSALRSDNDAGSLLRRVLAPPEPNLNPLPSRAEVQ